MVRLRKLLSDSSKARRHRRNVVNLQITFLTWLIEVFGFLLIFLGTFILGHENNVVNSSMQLLTMIIYFNILPCIFLINDSAVKAQIIESNWYNRFLNISNCQYTIQRDREGTAEIVENEMNQANPVENRSRPNDIHDDKNENNIRVTEQFNREMEYNETKKNDDNGHNTQIPKQNSERQPCRKSEETNQLLDVINDVVVVDLEI
jgi:hypothetical protein